jgi:hypothetical protein
MKLLIMIAACTFCYSSYVSAQTIPVKQSTKKPGSVKKASPSIMAEANKKLPAKKDTVSNTIKLPNNVNAPDTVGSVPKVRERWPRR